jgi:hypothetical protein
MKQGSLFCYVQISQTKTCRALGIFEKLSMSMGALTSFEIVWSYVVEAIDH